MTPFKPKKSLGQNFLIDLNYQKKIVAAVRQKYEGETIVEIGPGRGAITQHLALFADRLILVEKDRDLARALTERYHDWANVTVICEDFLKWDPASLPSQKNWVVGNLPYNVASQIFIRLLQNIVLFPKLFLMFQKEVALRCVGHPGNKAYGILSVWAQIFTTPEILFDLPPSVFSPRPKVTSSFVLFNGKEASFKHEASFIWFVRKVFGQRRKKLSTILKRDLPKDLSEEWKNMLDKRAEALTVAELKSLYGFLVLTMPKMESNRPC